MTISVGIASAARGDDRRTLFAAADGVLYDAKRSGRDRVVRLSGVTQTRAPGGSPLDALFGPPPSEPTAGAPDDAGRRDALLSRTCSLPRWTTRHRRRRFRSAPDRARRPAAGHRQRRRAAARARCPTRAASRARARAARRRAVEPEVIWAHRPHAPSRSSPWSARPAASTPTARRWCCARRAETLVALASEHDAYTTMDAAAMAAAVGPLPEPVGRVRVLCAGGGDTPVAAEAAFVARVTGTEVVRVDDVGGSRIRALLADGTLLGDVDCLVVVAGLDASLATMIGAMTDVPVVAVPTSTGQPSAFGGLGALMTMLNSAAPGVAVSNIDNGYSAGVFAARVARERTVTSRS